MVGVSINQTTLHLSSPQPGRPTRTHQPCAPRTPSRIVSTRRAATVRKRRLLSARRTQVYMAALGGAVG